MNRYIAISIVIIAVATAILSDARPSSSSPRKSLKTHEVLAKIGFSKVRTPNSHHKKRLAVESRQHGRSDDSHMYIIKLPPNQHYYVHNRPNSLAREPSKNLPVGFKNNGRPGKIYHWNMPVLKKLSSADNNSKKRQNVNTRPNNRVITFANHNWNDVLDKPEKKTGKKSKKDNSAVVTYKKQSYYVPTKPKKSSFFKYFPGNGKPKAFYVIDSKETPVQ